MLAKDKNINWTDSVQNKKVLHRVQESKYPAYNKEKEGQLDWSYLT